VSARTKARKRALDVLFECEARGLPLGATLQQRQAAAAQDAREPAVTPYVIELVHGVAAHQSRIDEVLTDVSRDWALDRMPAVDRNLLRIGVYEVLWGDDVPDAVAVSEAVSLATDLSTHESPGFVNGVLGRVVADKALLLANGGGSQSQEPPHGWASDARAVDGSASPE
jgi:transcription antitermination protein NusB